MPRCNVSNSAGLTLLESTIVIAIIGILMAIGIPSLLALQDRLRLAQAQDMVVASLLETQNEAIRRARNCKLTLVKTDRKIISSQGCLLAGDRQLPDRIALNYSGASGEIEYGIRGNTTTNKSIVVFVQGTPSNARCLTVSAPLGIIRPGSYNLNSTNNADMGSCGRLRD